MEKGNNNQEEKEYRTPVSIFEAIRAVKSNSEEKLSSQETDPERRKKEKEHQVKQSHLFPFYNCF